MVFFGVVKSMKVLGTDAVNVTVGLAIMCCISACLSMDPDRLFSPGESGTSVPIEDPSLWRVEATPSEKKINIQEDKNYWKGRLEHLFSGENNSGNKCTGIGSMQARHFCWISFYEKKKAQVDSRSRALIDSKELDYAESFIERGEAWKLFNESKLYADAQREHHWKICDTLEVTGSRRSCYARRNFSKITSETR